MARIHEHPPPFRADRPQVIVCLFQTVKAGALHTSFQLHLPTFSSVAGGSSRRNMESLVAMSLSGMPTASLAPRSR